MSFAIPPGGSVTDMRGAHDASRIERLPVIESSGDASRVVGATPPTGFPKASIDDANAPGANEATSRRAEGVSPAATEENAVLHVLDRYRQAYRTMNVTAVAEVWPLVDRRALARGFAAVKSQRLAFERCTVGMEGPNASAYCRGTISAKMVDNATERTEQYQWLFTLRRAAGEWRVEKLVAAPATAP